MSMLFHQWSYLCRDLNDAENPTWPYFTPFSVVCQCGSRAARRPILVESLRGLPAEEAEHLSQSGYFDWYETAESQAVLTYQRTSFACFLELLKLAIEEALGGLE